VPFTKQHNSTTENTVTDKSSNNVYTAKDASMYDKTNETSTKLAVVVPFDQSNVNVQSRIFGTMPAIICLLSSIIADKRLQRINEHSIDHRNVTMTTVSL
jgi:hypothetical protein